MSAPYQLLPPLTAEEYAALKADIAARGVMVPIERDEAGAILDGHNRAAIAAELGIDAPSVTRDGWTEAQKRDHVLKLNLLRRQLGPIAWAEAFRTLAEARGVRLGQGARNDRTSDNVSEVTVSSWRGAKDRTYLNQLVAELGVSTRTARRRLRLADDLAQHPDLVQQVDAGEIEARRAQRVVRDREARATREAQAELRANIPALPPGDGGESWIGPASVRCEIIDQADRAKVDLIDRYSAHSRESLGLSIPTDPITIELSEESRSVAGVPEALDEIEHAVSHGRREVAEALAALRTAVKRGDRRVARAVTGLKRIAENASAEESIGGPNVPDSTRRWSRPALPSRLHCGAKVAFSGWVKKETEAEKRAREVSA